MKFVSFSKESKTAATSSTPPYWGAGQGRRGGTEKPHLVTAPPWE